MGPGPERPPAATLTKVVDKAERRAALAKLAPEALALTRGRVDQAVGDRPDVWIWKPNTEVEIVIASGCNATAHLAAGDYKDKCGVLIEGSKRYFEAWGTVAQLEEGGRLRLRGADAKGSFTRDVTFSEGHVEVGERAARK